MADLTGSTLGNYRILERIGRGGMATVYKAYQPALERNVAVKVIHDMLAADDDQFLKRFHREAKAVAALRHPHIVQVFDFGTEGDQSYMVMEYLEGITLKAELRALAEKDETMRWQEVQRIFQAVASAVEHAHSQGMVHRDLKPANIMLTDKGEVILTDFGIARIVGGTQYTATGMIAGTPTYMSPEQGQGERGDARSDIYALGVILYEMLTGQVPFEADTPWAVIVKHISDPLPLPRQLNSAIPEEVEQVILKALAKEPSDRYQSAADMATALEGSTVGETRQIDQPEMPVRTIMAEVARSSPTAAPQGIESASVAETEASRAPRPMGKAFGIPPWLWLVGGVLLGGLLAASVILLNNSEPGGPAPTVTVIAVQSGSVSTLQVTATLTSPPTMAPTSTIVEKEITATAAPSVTPRPSLTPPPKPTLPTPPKEGRMLFACEGMPLQICVFDYRTGQTESVTNQMDFRVFGGAAWSPDADQIAFSAALNERDPQKIYVIDADGSNLIQLTFGDTYDHEVVWSPDGLWLAFHRNCALWLMRPDGTDGHPIMVSDDYCIEVPTFSPDGQQLAFLSHRPPGFRGIWVVNKDGSDPREAYAFAQPVRPGGWVGWSGDGQQLGCWFGNEGFQGFLINADGSGQPQPIPGPFDWWHVGFWPRWGKTDFSTMRMVSTNLGAQNEEYGLSQVLLEDGMTTTTTVDDVAAQVTLANEFAARYVYFNVNDDFLFAEQAHVIIQVVYFDQGFHSFSLDYDSTDSQGDGGGRFKKADLEVFAENSETWKTATFELADAFFGNRQHVGQADFRLAAGDHDLTIHRVAVSLP